MEWGLCYWFLSVLVVLPYVSCSTYLVPRVTLSYETMQYRFEGTLATYSNASISSTTGILLAPGSSFGCSDIDIIPSVPGNGSNSSDVSSAEASKPASNPSEPFVVIVPKTACEDYYQAAYAASIGARAVVFYSTQSGTLTSSLPILGIPVVYTGLSAEDKDTLEVLLGLENAQVTVELIDAYYYYRTQQTFYFVVFAFTMLILLSLVWFVVSYMRRCYDTVRTRRERVREFVQGANGDILYIRLIWTVSRW